MDFLKSIVLLSLFFYSYMLACFTISNYYYWAFSVSAFLISSYFSIFSILPFNRFTYCSKCVTKVYSFKISPITTLNTFFYNLNCLSLSLILFTLILFYYFAFSSNSEAFTCDALSKVSTNFPIYSLFGIHPLPLSELLGNDYLRKAVYWFVWFIVYFIYTHDK
jgi:hypothetical protein